MLTLRDLQSVPSLGLRLLVSGDALDKPVDRVSFSELADPTPLLTRGELLLTTARVLRDDPEACDGYVRRLVQAGVTGCGVGVAFEDGSGSPRPAVPDALVEACAAHRFTLLELSQPGDFVAITDAVWRSRDHHYEELTRAHDAHQQLTRAALAAEAPTAVLRRLERLVDGWAAVCDPIGAPWLLVSETARGQVDALAAELEQLRSSPPPASTTLQRGEVSVTLQALGSGQRARGFLLVGRSGKFSVADKRIVNSAAALFTLLLERATGQDRALAALRPGLLSLLLSGHTEVVQPAAEHLCGGLPPTPVRVLAVLADPAARQTFAEVVDHEAAQRQEAAFHSLSGDQLVVLLAADRRLQQRLLGLSSQLGVRIGVSEPVGYDRLELGCRQAERAVSSTAEPGDVTWYDEVAASGLLSLVDSAAARAYAFSLLSPLIEHDRIGRGDLSATLRCWLEQHGQWEPTAARLGVHRHTLRRRIAHAEELLDRSLGSPGVRAELWLAFEAIGDEAVPLSG